MNRHLNMHLCAYIESKSMTIRFRGVFEGGGGGDVANVSSQRFDPKGLDPLCTILRYPFLADKP